MSLLEKKCVCCHEWNILEEKLEVEDVDCVMQHMDFDVTCLNHSVLACCCYPELIDYHRARYANDVTTGIVVAVCKESSMYRVKY